MSHLFTTGKRSISTWVWVVLRGALGLILIWKGINFIRDTYIVEVLTGQTTESQFSKNEAVVIGLTMMLMIIGGIFMMLGLFTEMVSLVQLPIFSIGALYIHAGYIERSGFELVLTSLVPILLLIFISKGNHEPPDDSYSRSSWQR